MTVDRSRTKLTRDLILTKTGLTVGAALLCTFALLLTASGGAAQAGRQVPRQATQGGTASYALGTGQAFTWMFPLPNYNNYTGAIINIVSDMWRPLYFAGGPGQTGVNYNLSLAYKPVFSNNDRTVAITLKHGYKWSDGQPVTTSDVQFFFQLMQAGIKLGKYAPYTPGFIPDNIKSITYNSPYQMTLQLKRSYNPVWFLDDDLTFVIPLPRQAWDRTCETCAVGNEASTLSGAEAVYNFLYAQSSKLTTYATNPIWQVVDGPWVISSYNSTTFYSVFTANKAYTGPDRPHLASYAVYSFGSDTAEVDALRSGELTFGWVSLGDLGTLRSLEAEGYTFQPWYIEGNNYMELGYTSKVYGPLVKQLYIRQVLQHLVDEPLYIKSTMYGYGLQDYGPVPESSLLPANDEVSPQLANDPYPYSLSTAESLLSTHGWAKNSAGWDVCVRPGAASNECGPGIAKGKQLTLLFLYMTGVQFNTDQVEAFASAAKQVGVDIVLDGQLASTVGSLANVCPPGPCNWGIAGWAGIFVTYGQYGILPAGETVWGVGNYSGGGYYDPTAQGLIDGLETESGLSHLFAEQNYLSKQVASLWWPMAPNFLVLVKKGLRGWDPLNPYGDYMPSYWYFTK